MVDTEVVGSNGLKVKPPEIFVEVLRDRRGFVEFDNNSVDKL